MPSPSMSLIVPLHGVEPSRVAAWAWLRRRYEALYPDWQIIEARSDAVPWRKGVALTQGVMRASGDVLIFADGDVAISHEALTRAVAMVDKGASWVVPHRLVHRLSQTATQALLVNTPNALTFNGAASLERPKYAGFTGGGIFVVSRSNWIKSGGIPHEFAGWGGEDESLGVILDTLIGPHVRMEYDLYHLWHEAPKRIPSPQNKSLLEAYRMAAGDPEAMRHLILHGAELIASMQSGKVRMITEVEFRRGSQIKKPGDIFEASVDEAKRHAMRKVRLARPFLGPISPLPAPPTKRPSFEERNLARAGGRYQK